MKKQHKKHKTTYCSKRILFQCVSFLALQYVGNIRNNKKQNRQGVLLKKERD